MTSNSARPVRPNRPLNLDDPRVSSFIGKAAGEGERPAAHAPRAEPESAPHPPAPAKTLAPAGRRAPKEVLRPLTLRVPEDVHDALSWLAENSPWSMNGFSVEAIRKAVFPAVERVKKAKDLGLSAIED